MGKYVIKHSTELMQNYLQATIMAPEKEFKALQKSDGGALLFSIGDVVEGGSFNVTVETAGERHGWKAVNLSKDFPGSPCQHFAVAQRADGSINMAMVLRETNSGQSNDHLYISVLSLSKTGNINPPQWTAFPYDDTKHSLSRLEIAGIFLSEATDGEYIVADVVRDPNSPTKEIVRYYIDRAKQDGQAWHKHDVPIDIESGKYTSVLGRKDGATVDGIYTSGQIDGSPQIIYTPLYNDIRPDRHPDTDSLMLTPEGNLVADAIAVCANSDNTTDLYATANGVLYRFASTNQRNKATAEVAAQYHLFQGVKDLFAFPYGDSVMVWGRNSDNAIFYTTCPSSKLNTPDAWSVPVPILIGVEQVSPFVNRANSANTIFAHTGESELKIGVKSPGTGRWTWRNVTLPPADTKAPAQKFNSYTTRIQVTDADHQPANGVTIAISATSVTSVYINHLYYIVGPDAIHVKTDVAGSLTIVEAVERLTGTQFVVSVADDAAGKTSINPMDKAFKKATDLQSKDKLKAAKIVSYVKGPNGPVKATPRNLVRDGVDDATLEQVAKLNVHLASVYADPKKGPAPNATLGAAQNVFGDSFPVPANAPQVDAGDLFQFLEAKSAEVKFRVAASEAGGLASPQESFWEMLVRWFEDAWEFVVKIGEAIYRCVLNVIEDVVSAVRWAFDKIVAAVEDLIEFVRYLFEWDDFKRTKDVLRNVTKLFLDHQADQIPVVKKEFDDAVESAIKAINKWAGIKEFPGLGTAGSGRMSSQNKADGPDAPGSLLSHHFQGNVTSASQDTTPSVPDPASSVMDVLENALLNEEKRLGEAFDQLKALMQNAHNMSVIDILKALTGILVDAVLRSAQVVIDALLDLFSVVAKKAMDIFDRPIHIPVISDILNAIGIPDFSMLDILCWIAAVPVTIGYKLAAALAGEGDKAPFPDNDETKRLIGATDFQSLVAAFNGAAHSLQSADTAQAEMTAAGPIPMSKETAEAVFISLHTVAGACGLVSAVLDFSESQIPNAAVPTTLTVACVASAIVGGGSRAAANTLVPQYPIESSFFGTKGLGFSQSYLFLINKALWSMPGQLILGNLSKWKTGQDWKAALPKDPRAMGACFDAAIVLPALVCTCWHFHELSQKPEGKARAIAFLDETSFMATYIARVMYTAVVTGLLDADKEVEFAAAVVIGVAQVAHGGLQITEAALQGIA
ncbi:MAG TPA: hypothetical protein VJ464_12310 [Blastocatellia bacterium]|nr:hypothetical protein [Blastocatellia bacterium]